nr:energy transducer TonB [uncultured Sphingomonas sp.]
MLAYAANQRSRRRLSPSALLLIGAGHAIAIGLLITAKMDIDIFTPPPRTEVYNVPLPPPPPEPPRPQPRVQQQERLLPPPPDSRIDNLPPIIPTPQPPQSLDVGPAINSSLPDIGPALANSLPPTLPPPPQKAAVVKVGPRATTPADLLRPPYPEAKRRTDEEAVLRLRLTIDERGRVTAVEPIGAVDAAFLASARSHLVRHWRYRPATEDGRAVSSTLAITLRFKLED